MHVEAIDPGAQHLCAVFVGHNPITPLIMRNQAQATDNFESTVQNPVNLLLSSSFSKGIFTGRLK